MLTYVSRPMHYIRIHTYLSIHITKCIFSLRLLSAGSEIITLASLSKEQNRHNSLRLRPDG